MDPEEGCPACGETVSGRRLFRRAGWTYALCDRCGHGYGTPDANAEARLVDLYHDHYAGFRDDPLFQANIRSLIDREFRGRIPAGGAILDVGCGNGEFLKAACEAGFAASGVDISQTAVDLCRSRGLSADVADFATMQAVQRYDAITLWDVVEHLPNPGLFAQRAREMLRPGGYLVMKTPAVTAATLRLVRVLPRLAPPLLSTPGHVQFFNDRSMELMGRRIGYAESRVGRIGPMRGKRRTGGPLRRVRRATVAAVLSMLGADDNLFSWFRA